MMQVIMKGEILNRNHDGKTKNPDDFDYADYEEPDIEDFHNLTGVEARY